MLKPVAKNEERRRIHARIRRRVRGDSRLPRLNVFRSANHIYAQLVDDSTGQTLASASSCDKALRQTLKTGGSIAAARSVGKTLAERARAAGIERVVFDRGGYAYHGRVKVLAESAREGGLSF